MSALRLIQGGGEGTILDRKPKVKKPEVEDVKPPHEIFLEKLAPMNDDFVKILGADWIERDLPLIYQLDSFRHKNNYSDEGARKIHPLGPVIVWILSKLDTDQPPPRPAAAAKGRRSTTDEDQSEDLRMAA